MASQTLSTWRPVVFKQSQSRSIHQYENSAQIFSSSAELEFLSISCLVVVLPPPSCTASTVLSPFTLDTISSREEAPRPDFSRETNQAIRLADPLIINSDFHANRLGSHLSPTNPSIINAKRRGGGAIFCCCCHHVDVAFVEASGLKKMHMCVCLDIDVRVCACL